MDMRFSSTKAFNSRNIANRLSSAAKSKFQKCIEVVELLIRCGLPQPFQCCIPGSRLCSTSAQPL